MGEGGGGFGDVVDRVGCGIGDCCFSGVGECVGGEEEGYGGGDE